MLTATFVRHRGGRDHIYVTRADGTVVHWKFPAYGDGLPHDLVHLVVESGLEMRDGFWGLIDRGAGDGVQRGYVIPAAYVPPELAAVRLRLLDLQRGWAALPDRGSITVSFG